MERVSSLNVRQTINSFLRPTGLSLSSKEQMITKVATLAIITSAIFLAANSSLAEAKSINHRVKRDPFSDCLAWCWVLYGDLPSWYADCISRC